MARGTHNWTVEKITEVKKVIKAELERALKDEGASGQRKRLIERIKELEDQDKDDAQLRRFIYVVSALVHHIRFDGFSPKQILDFQDIGDGLLKIHGLERRSKLSVLFSDMYLTISQIYRKESRWWEALWESELGRYYSNNNISGGSGFYLMNFAGSELRLGFAKSAFDRFSEAKDQLQNSDWRGYCAISQVRCLRLSGQRAKARALINEVGQMPVKTASIENELLWESICLEVSENQNPLPMINAIRAGNPLHLGTYIAETQLWVCAVPKKEWLDKINKIRVTAGSKKVRLDVLGHLYRAATTISDCYDDSIPLPIRFRRLGLILKKIDESDAIDRELLTLAASARWLERARFSKLSEVIWNKYKSVSLNLSDGQNKDVLNIRS